jgi:hypothetical protein
LTIEVAIPGETFIAEVRPPIGVKTPEFTCSRKYSRLT